MSFARNVLACSLRSTLWYMNTHCYQTLNPPCRHCALCYSIIDQWCQRSVTPTPYQHAHSHHTPSRYHCPPSRYHHPRFLQPASDGPDHRSHTCRSSAGHTDGTGIVSTDQIPPAEVWQEEHSFGESYLSG